MARRFILAATIASLVMSAGGCGHGSGGFPDRTARFTVDGSTTTFDVVSCGLDHQTAFVVGRAADGSIVQAAIGVAADHTTGVPRSTGVSVNQVPLADGSSTTLATVPPTANPGAAIAASTTVPAPVIGGYEAFGTEAWNRRGQTGYAPGTIASARVKGARIQATGTAQPVGDADAPTGSAPLPFRFDARCDATAKH